MSRSGATCSFRQMSPNGNIPHPKQKFVDGGRIHTREPFPSLPLIAETSRNPLEAAFGSGAEEKRRSREYFKPVGRTRPESDKTCCGSERGHAGNPALTSPSRRSSRSSALSSRTLLRMYSAMEKSGCSRRTSATASCVSAVRPSWA